MKPMLIAALCAGLAAPALADSHGANFPATTTINGYIPPGKVERLHDKQVMLRQDLPDGTELYVARGVRKAGTRVGIHVHEYGGHTCVLSGMITDFVEGKDPMIFPAGTCYYMPADTPMTATNLGTVDAVLIDTFIVPKGQPFITIIEPGADDH